MKEVFEQVGIRQKYADYEQGAYERITGFIETIPVEGAKDSAGGVLRREVFTAFLNKIYKRTK